MPDITLPNDISSDTTTVAANLEDNLYDPNSTQDTFEVFNGGVDEANLHTSALPIPREATRSGAFMRGDTRGANANADIFQEFFQGNLAINDGNWIPETDAKLKALAVPGACLTFYVPWDDASGVYLSWHIGVVVDNANVVPGVTGMYPNGTTTWDNGDTYLMLVVDGTDGVPITRRFKDGLRSMVDSNTGSYSAGPGTFGYSDSLRPDHRWWSGHAVIDTGLFAAANFDKGWHTAELRVCTDSKHVRFKTRRMTAIPFR